MIMVDIYCSRCGIFIVKERELPPEKVFCGRCIVDVLQAKLQLATDLARAVRRNHDEHWDMPQSVMIALENYEEAIGEHRRN